MYVYVCTIIYILSLYLIARMLSSLFFCFIEWDVNVSSELNKGALSQCLPHMQPLQHK